MRFLRRGRGRIAALAVLVVTAAGVGTAVAATMADPPSNAVSHGRGINEFGMTKAFYDGHTTDFTYTRGFFCDNAVRSKASSNCEAGALAKNTPSKHFDPLYITVPLGFKVGMKKMDCPNGLVCVDHPGTIDLTRLEPALKPLYPKLTNKQLTAALRNVATPGHDHFITTRNGGRPEWWDVKVVGVTSRSVYNKIHAHKSFRYLNKQIKAGHTTGAIPTNLFLFFGVK